MKKKTITGKLRISPFVLILVIGLFILFGSRLVYLCTTNFKVGNISIKDFISKRNVNKEILYPERGTIYDKGGTILAQDVSSYKVIAYLSEKRDVNPDVPLHVVDKEMTAEKLSPHINMSKEDILKLLSKENLYQVELGPGGRNLSQSVVEEIKKLELPGIDFVKSSKRYYPNGNYASYTLGYTVNKGNDNNETNITGELGIEGYYDDILRGTNGYLEYEKDKNGYKIPNGRQYVKEALNGNDIYLTLDNNIQLFAENAVKKAKQNTGSDWVLLMIVDAKTGAILGNSSDPSFDPNLRDMTSYLNPFVSYSYEPGSTMKIFSYMCAVEKGTYDGNATFMSGSKSFADQRDPSIFTTINDWNKVGWGTLTYDQGFALSSNIGVANLLETAINRDDLKACYEKYGFGKKTGFTMTGEIKGTIDFKYPIEVANAGYGQGIATTPMQHIQALSAIANDGEMLKPFIISKIIDPNTGKYVEEAKRTVVSKIASKETTNKMKELMRSVINGDSSTATGTGYYVPGYDVIGKTGTAQIFDSNTGKYLTGYKDYIYSFAGMFPGDDPDILIYAAMKKPEGGSYYLTEMVKEIIDNVGKYYAVNETTTDTSKNIEMENYVSKKINDVKKSLKESGIEPIVLGTGDIIVKQYPSKGVIVNSKDKVFLITNNYDNSMPNLHDYSYKEATSLLNLLNIKYKSEGNGFLYEQSIESGTIINQGEEVYLKFKMKYET